MIFGPKMKVAAIVPAWPNPGVFRATQGIRTGPETVATASCGPLRGPPTTHGRGQYPEWRVCERYSSTVRKSLEILENQEKS